MFRCICCDWILNKGLKQRELERIAKQVGLWASKEGLNGEEIIEKILDRIDKIKLNLNLCSAYTNICRYCLMEQIEVLLDKKEDAFRKEFVNNYDFNGAIIC